MSKRVWWLALALGISMAPVAYAADEPADESTITVIEDAELLGLDREDFIPAVTGHGEASEQAERLIGSMLSLG